MVSTEHLIEIIKKYPPLYDRDHPKYGVANIQGELWERIASMFKTDVDLVKSAWENIKATFIKYAKEEKSDGDRQMKKGYSYLHFIKCMEFFKPFFNISGKPNGSVRLRSKSGESSDHSESTDVSASFSDDFLCELKNPFKDRSSTSANLFRNCRTSAPRMVNKTNLAHPATQNQEVQSGLYADSKAELQRLSPAKMPQDMFLFDYPMKSIYMNHGYSSGLDAIELIFLGYAKTLKTFSPIRQTYTKMKIAQVIMEQEMQHLDENPNTPTKLISSTRTNSVILANFKDANSP